MEKQSFYLCHLERTPPLSFWNGAIESPNKYSTIHARQSLAIHLIDSTRKRTAIGPRAPRRS